VLGRRRTADPVTPDTSCGHGVFRASDDTALFAVLWAFVTLFHLWVNPWSRGVFRQLTLLGMSHVLLAVLAFAVLLRPRSLRSMAVLALTGIGVVWLEAPILGNHWLLAGIVDLAFLGALLKVSRQRSADGPQFSVIFTAMARAVLIAFYVFAALAKLNHGFVNARVSCATFFGDELLRSLHLGQVQGGTRLASVLPWAVIAIELAIPVLLAVRRTRVIGVVLGLGYHSLIGLDLTHAFSDFSSVLTPLFILFLPATFASDVVRFVQERAKLVVRARNVLMVASATTLVSMWIGGNGRARRVLVGGRQLMWLIFDALVLLVVGAWCIRTRVSVEPRQRLRPAWLALIPALVVVNGLTPYLELKTSYGWNMYANLETVDGQSNHLFLPGTLRLTDIQHDLVRILETNDEGLKAYVREGYDIPFLQLRAYLSNHARVSLVYERGGSTRRADPVASDPALVRPVGSGTQKLLAFRAVDRSRPVRCQPTFLPAD